MRARASIAIACAVLACSGGDAPSDASPIDAGLDTRVDAGATDAGHDAAVPDTGTDAHPLPDDPMWERVTFFPDACNVFRARAPEALMAFHWMPGVDDLPACQMPALDRMPHPLRNVSPLSGGNDLRSVMLWVFEDNTIPETQYVITRDDVPAAAWLLRTSSDPHVGCVPELTASAVGVGVDENYNLDTTALHDGFTVAP